LQIFREIKPNLLSASSLALGMFDGVHEGHRMVLADAVQKAELMGTLATVVTFANHPQCITCKTPTRQLTTLEERLELFKIAGIKAALILEFTSEFSEMSAEAYLKTILVEGLNAKSITIGYDHCFGRDRQGDYNFLIENKDKFGYAVDVIQPVTIDGQIISSSVIRNFITIGNMDFASKLLGRPYSLKGTVVEGKKRGAGLGFPTANLKVEENLVIPACGIYSGKVEFEGNTYKSVINIGKNPTFGDIDHISIEIHIFDFSKNLYNKKIKVSFIQKLRDEKKFSSVDELVKQIKIDCENAKKSLE